MAQIDALLQLVQKHGASDLHVRPGAPAMIRLHGQISPLSEQVVSRELLDLMLSEIMDDEARARLERDKDVDFAYEVPGVLRARCNVFLHDQGLAVALRVLPGKAFTIDELGLPAALTQLTTLPRGLVIVTGPPGSGKSTTLAALIDHINRHQRKHILTIEDPLEYRHVNQRSLVTHREVGRHATGFARALRAALREDPDVIMVGEMRDPETTALAVTAAATGQLVLATLHTPSAGQSVDRILDLFDGERQVQVRLMLAESLKCVLAQRLLRRADGSGRVLALEVLMGSYAVASLIRERKTFQLTSVMQTGRREGMQTLDDAILRLLRDDIVDAEEAQIYLSSRDAAAKHAKAPPVPQAAPAPARPGAAFPPAPSQAEAA